MIEEDGKEGQNKDVSERVCWNRKERDERREGIRYV